MLRMSIYKKKAIVAVFTLMAVIITSLIVMMVIVMIQPFWLSQADTLRLMCLGPDQSCHIQ